jgi:hypothetical protein
MWEYYDEIEFTLLERIIGIILIMFFILITIMGCG